MLPSVESSVIEFKNPEIPIIRLNAWNNDIIRTRARTDQASDIRGILSAGNVFREPAAVGSC
jgi:hypothetical protein